MSFHGTPFLFVLSGLLVFLATYFAYSKWIDRRVWQSDPARPTPAHMYADGVEFFPVGRYVLYGFQFNSIAALGPILGPGVALAYGWLPALLWILFANLFLGWAQDYSAMFLSVRAEGKSFGPLAYEMLGPRPRKLLLSYLLFYFILINAAFIFVVGTVLDAFPGVWWALLVLVLASFLVGHLIFKTRTNIITVTAIAIVLLVFGVVFGANFRWPATGALGAAPYTLWYVPLIIILILGSLLPLPRLVTPMNYITYYPVIVAIIALAVGALASPLTGVTIARPAFTNFLPAIGPLWPVLFVTIACGAVSGWHSLISSGITSRQLDVETDARPVGAGAMLTEGVVALTALGAYMVLSTKDFPGVGTPPSFVFGSVALTNPLFGGAAKAFLETFFGIYMVFMAVTILTILGRYWRVVSAEIFGGTSVSFLGNKYVASVLGFVFPIAFVLTGSWINIWIYFGGTNQLLAGFALTLAAIFLMTQRRFHWYTLIPGLFMMFTTLAALLVESFWDFLPRVVEVPWRLKLAGVPFPQQKPLVDLAGKGAATALNVFSVAVGVVMFAIGAALLAYMLRATMRARAGTLTAPAAAPAS